MTPIAIRRIRRGIGFCTEDFSELLGITEEHLLSLENGELQPDGNLENTLHLISSGDDRFTEETILAFCQKTDMDWE